jgi:hypothetical protein
MIRVVYFYAIAFITLMMLIGGSISFFVNTANYVKPAPYYLPQSDYKMSEIGAKEKTYAAYKQKQIDTAKQDGLRGMVSSMGWILIPGVVYLFVNRRIHRMEV